MALPEGVEDAVVNRAVLARALGKTEPMIDKYIAAGMPVLQKGSNGRAYQFQLSEAWDWLEARKRVEAEASEQAERSAQQLRLHLVGGKDVRGIEAGLSPKEQRETYDAERGWNLAAKDRRELVLAVQVIEAMSESFLILREAITSIPDVLEREAGLDGKTIERVQRVTDAALAGAHARMSEAVDDRLTQKAAE